MCDAGMHRASSDVRCEWWVIEWSSSRNGLMRTSCHPSCSSVISVRVRHSLPPPIPNQCWTPASCLACLPACLVLVWLRVYVVFLAVIYYPSAGSPHWLAILHTQARVHRDGRTLTWLRCGCSSSYREVASCGGQSVRWACSAATSSATPAAAARPRVAVPTVRPHDSARVEARFYSSVRASMCRTSCRCYVLYSPLPHSSPYDWQAQALLLALPWRCTSWTQTSTTRAPLFLAKLQSATLDITATIAVTLA
jgi:hypothetical protein